MKNGFENDTFAKRSLQLYAIDARLKGSLKKRLYL